MRDRGRSYESRVMRTLLTQFRSFDRPSQVLMVNQFTINVGFYMLMPYLAGYLAGPLGLAAWAVGLVLGLRNFSQQGMFLLGGTLADRLGFKPLIVAGCLLRVAGFVLLAAVELAGPRYSGHVVVEPRVISRSRSPRDGAGGCIGQRTRPASCSRARSAGVGGCGRL